MSVSDRHRDLILLNLLTNGLDRDKDGVLGATDLLAILRSIGVYAELEDAELLIENVSMLTRCKSQRSMYSGLYGFTVNCLERFFHYAQQNGIAEKGDLWGVNILKMNDDEFTPESLKNSADALGIPMSEADCEDAIRLWAAVITNPEYVTDTIRHLGSVPNPPYELAKELALNMPHLSTADLLALFNIYS